MFKLDHKTDPDHSTRIALFFVFGEIVPKEVNALNWGFAQYFKTANLFVDSFTIHGDMAYSFNESADLLNKVTVLANILGLDHSSMQTMSLIPSIEFRKAVLELSSAVAESKKEFSPSLITVQAFDGSISRKRGVCLSSNCYLKLKSALNRIYFLFSASA